MIDFDSMFEYESDPFDDDFIWEPSKEKIEMFELKPMAVTMDADGTLYVSIPTASQMRTGVEAADSIPLRIVGVQTIPAHTDADGTKVSEELQLRLVRAEQADPPEDVLHIEAMAVSKQDVQDAYKAFCKAINAEQVSIRLRKYSNRLEVTASTDEDGTTVQRLYEWETIGACDHRKMMAAIADGQRTPNQ